MLSIPAHGTLRSRYVSDRPTYKGCVNCKKQFAHAAGGPLAGMPMLSRYPYCMKCLKKNAKDPGFVQWLNKLFFGKPA